MEFVTLGTTEKPAILMVHGLATTAELCYGKIARALARDYCVILAKLDGHNEKEDSEFESIVKECEQIEYYVGEYFEGHLYAVIGFSLGGTIAANLVARQQMIVDKVFLDAAFCVEMGVFASIFRDIFVKQIKNLQKNGKINPICLAFMGGKRNLSLIRMLYDKVHAETIYHALNSGYHYKKLTGLIDCTSEVMFIYGSREPFPALSARNLKKLLPSMKIKIVKHMGHGQFLNEHPGKYYHVLREFLKS